jgi:phage I-like protein
MTTALEPDRTMNSRIILPPVMVVAAGEATESRTREVLLVPAGMVKTKSGIGSFLMDAAAAELTIAAFSDHGVEVVIDYEHQTLPEFAPRDGKAPASGWIRALRFDPARGLLGDVEWTAEALSDLAAKRYQYLSPVVNVRTSDKRVFALHSAGLTNKPAIVAMDKLAASERTAVANADGGMELVDQLADVLRSKGVDVPEGADLAAVLRAAIDRLAAAADSGDPQPNSEVVTLRSELTAMKQAAREREAQDVIDFAINSRRISARDEAKLGFVREQAMKDPAQARAIVNMLPEVRPPQGRLTPLVDGPAAPAERSSIIANAAREYRENGTLQSVTSLRAFVDMKLGEANSSRLADEEFKALAAR